MKKLASFLISIYKNSLSRVFEHLFGKGCRFVPTCSEYAKEAVNKYGTVKGSGLFLKRFVKCHPFYKGEVFDPVK